MVLGVRDHLELITPEAWKREQERLAPNMDDIWRHARQALAAQHKAQG
jgi:hypothetical protein